jgi:hypothetical protein
VANGCDGDLSGRQVPDCRCHPADEADIGGHRRGRPACVAQDLELEVGERRRQV